MIITNETIFWTQVVSIIGFVIVLFVLYRLLVEQKDATIQTLKEKVAILKDQLEEANKLTPDILVQTQSSRIKLLDDELKKLAEDHMATKEAIQAKQDELDEAIEKRRKLWNKVVGMSRDAFVKLNIPINNSCPNCGAPELERNAQTERLAYEGRVLNENHHYVEFECGYLIVEGDKLILCKNSSNKINE